jgi:hypothetical protein
VATWLGPLVFVLSLTTCTEDLTSPGNCPDFCPVAAISIIDTVLTGTVSGDSSFGRPNGYVDPDDAIGLLAADFPSIGRDSRPIMRTYRLASRVPIAADTTTGAVIGVDSLWLSFTVGGRDSAARNVRLGIYRLPLTIDSTTTFGDLTSSFVTPLRTVNLDSLAAHPGSADPVTGDSVAVDSANNRLRVFVKFDSAQVPLVAGDSGKLAFGIRVSADTLASVTIPSAQNVFLGPAVLWFVKADSAGAAVIHTRTNTSTARSLTAGGLDGFDSFVFQPPAAPLGTDLIVGGVPSVRTIMRLAVPRAIRDSARIILATLELIPTTPPVGIPADSFRVIAYPVIADFGAKSPLSTSFTDTTRIYITPVDTIRLNLTRVMINWTLNGALPTTLFLRQVPEGAQFAELHFHSSLDTPYRPRLRVTYSPRYPDVVK